MRLVAESAFMKTLNRLPSFFICLLGLLAPFQSSAQQAVGEWKFHLSYTEGIQIVGSEQQSLFALNPNGLYYYSGTNQELEELNRLDGLSSQDLKAIHFDDGSRQLILAHQNGVIDFISESEVIPFFGLSENEFIADKKINSFSSQGDRIWVAGAFGFAEIESRSQIFKETYLNLGANASALEIFAVAANDEFTFIATATGIRLARNDSNLKDFQSWGLIDDSDGHHWTQLISDQGAQFAQNELGEIFSFDEFGIEQIFGLSEITNLKVFKNGIFFQRENSIFSLDQNGNFAEVFLSDQVFIDFWRDERGFSLLLPNEGILLPSASEGMVFSGPAGKSQGLAFVNDKTISVSANYNPDRSISSSELAIASKLESGSWTDLEEPDSVTTIATWRNEIYYGTSSGLWKESETGQKEQVSLPDGSSDLPISSLATDAQGNLWVGVYDQISRLFQLSNEGIRSVPVPGLLLTRSMESDLQSRLWIVQGNRFGRTLRLFFPETGSSRSFGSANALGALPDDQVWDFFLDQRDRLWLATADGIAFLPSASLIESNTSTEAVRPLVNNSPALRGEEVLALAQSPDQSFFVGTRKSGLWHFSPDFDEILENYTPTNSPIPDLEVRDIVTDPKGGNIFMLAPQGILALRTGIKSEFPDLETLKIFPNPVSPEFNGLLTIEGLVDNSDILITDTAGRPVFRGFLKGGSFTWNLQDASGSRLKTGVYLVYVFDSAGNQRASGKFLVI